ncbi:MAG: CAP domain-containing protein [Bacillota bacterium]|nr:CAP domain-containing protein [Bacillota bacterium]
MNPGPLHVSSMFTQLDSNAYPHTRAVLIQSARYQFIPIYPNYGTSNGMGYLQQAPTYQAPTYQVPTNQAPTQQWRAPSQPSQTPTAQPSAQKTYSAPTQGISQFAQQVIDLTNVQRKQNGLPALKADTQLSGVAQKKAVEMQQKNYFSHTSPTYGSPFDMMRDFGVTYSSAGENIAMGQRTPQEVVNAWMNSPGHRANILSKSFTNIGVGVEQSGYHWSQMFIGK